MTRQLFFILSLTVLCSCKSTQDCPDVNTLPMFDRLKKCDEQIKADQIFLAACDKYYKTRDEATQHHIDMGWGYFYKNQFDSSIMRFNQAWLLDSTNADVFWGFGSVLGKQQHFQESLIYLDKSNEINPNNPKVWLCTSTSYGQMFYQNKDVTLLDKSIDDLKKSISLDPNYAQAYGQLAACYSYFTQKDSAKKYLALADKLDPSVINPEVRKILTE
jgi:tetratricopeptide (TPR) repeat protein